MKNRCEMVASKLVLLGLLSATSARGDECAGACYGCRFQQSAVCVNSSWVNAGSCVTAVGGQVPIGVPPPPTPKPPPNALLPALKRGPVPDGVYALPGLDVGPDLAFGPNHMLGFFRDTKCSEMCPAGVFAPEACRPRRSR